MKSSKKFATSHGQSHYPSNMAHIDTEFVEVVTPEGVPLLVLILQRHDTETPLQLNVRMSVFEARKLAEQLLKHADALCPHGESMESLKAHLTEQAFQK